jgi:hypothetical protein
MEIGLTETVITQKMQRDRYLFSLKCKGSAGHFGQILGGLSAFPFCFLFQRGRDCQEVSKIETNCAVHYMIFKINITI